MYYHYLNVLGSTFGSSAVKNNSKRLVSKITDKNGFQTASGKYNSAYYGGQILVAYDAKILDTMLLTPQIRLRYSASNNTGYTETGTTNQNLVVKNTKASNDTQGIIGARLQSSYNSQQGVLMIPEAHAFLYQSLGGNQGTVSAQLSGMPIPFVGTSIKINTLWNLGLSVNVKQNQTKRNMVLAYDAIMASNGYKANVGSLKVRVNF